MMALDWSEAYATGVRQIDDQHRRLFEMVNSLEKQLQRNEPPERLAWVLKELADYAARHFACEEDLMKQCGCATACVNRLAQQRFTRMVEERLASMRNGRLPDRGFFEGLHRDVCNWLREHICQIDLKMRAHAGSI
jgi:hemerythrin-like metal-binding protein